jgi:hypothetical protein
VGPPGICNWAFDSYVIYSPVIVSVLLLGFEVGIGASGDYEDCAMSWESFILLLGFLDLWWRLGWWIGFGFDLGIVVWRWVSDLWDCWRLCYLRDLWGGTLSAEFVGVAVGW